MLTFGDENGLNEYMNIIAEFNVKMVERHGQNIADYLNFDSYSENQLKLLDIVD